MRKTELAKRYGLFILSLFFSALGVAFSKRGELGISPISSVANVMNCAFPALSLGTWLTLWNCALIVGQVLLLRRRFQLIQLLQIPLSFLFGWFTDVGMGLVSHLPAESYPARMAMVAVGIVVLGFGIALAVIANVIMNSGEAFVKAAADVFRKDFGRVKTAFDLACVLAALALSLLLFDFTIVGIREGTVISALLTGVVVNFFRGRLQGPVNAVLSRQKSPRK